ncbi:aromatic acid exporter family protein [Desmospora profundinema]|uniref:Uncharacterized membrane protein YgaE (UPF0421/DUF939 family) n=1 Tax=Desmospora profundinema TaxID=1571184 RepID=A0ABU1IQD8_9BACL|nr:aromatic acid exporter family protein [Desmospora profundinema]MDR6227000.1 uncharacterized membrane protein YgaE (UPF0421/DUF939 family) [Desmospora profundinema]
MEGYTLERKRKLRLKIGYRTIKTALGTGLSVWLAREWGLDHYTMAGVITMLCIQPTIKRSVTAAFSRLLSGFLALLASGLVFTLAGYNIPAVILFFLLFIPLAARLNIQEGLVISAVVIFHIFLYKEWNASIFLNEMALILIGVVMALVLNLHMPHLEQRMERMRKQIDQAFDESLLRVAESIRAGESRWPDQELERLKTLMQQAEELGRSDVENHLFRGKGSFQRYLDVRKQQFYGLERMDPLLHSLRGQDPHGDPIAGLLEAWVEGKAVARDERELHSMEELARLYESFRADELPATREEFETRSALYQLLREWSHYIRWEQRLTGRPQS